ncbi:MAG: hypothetical protein U9N35_07310, partial [Euryarchaeota archaeon]|nr:hypothetical protein [Euryarchaeota archaeon]
RTRIKTTLEKAKARIRTKTTLEKAKTRTRTRITPAKARTRRGTDSMNSTKKVLVICDDADLSGLYKEILITYGFSHLDVTETAVRSLDYLKTTTYDIVVLDSRFPREDISFLREHTSGNTKCLYLTNTEENSCPEKIPYIIKPFDVSLFVKRVTAL